MKPFDLKMRGKIGGLSKFLYLCTGIRIYTFISIHEKIYFRSDSY